MSCAEVCLDMGYDEWNEFYNDSIRRARVTHRCGECDRTISPGEVYEYVSGKSDGRIWTAKTCIECVAIRGALVCGSWMFGELWAAIHEDVFPAWETTGPWDCLAKVEGPAGLTDPAEREAVARQARDALLSRWRAWRDETAVDSED